MEKYAWKGLVKEGCLEEYIRRHDNLPEDMKALLREAGICNYTIWNVGNELFGYYECKNGVDFAAKTAIVATNGVCREGIRGVIGSFYPDLH